MNRTVGLAAVVVVTAGSAVLSELPLRAPFSGIALVSTALGLVAIGYAGKSVYALGLAAICVAGTVVVVAVLSYSDGAESAPVYESNCDPSCGIPLSAFVAMTVTLALALASAGWAARALIDRRRS